ncbi:MAG: methionyl-tRNA formyltransferase [Lachnospiraceae bacterium]|nr:methionyl-tRNA formyltransferase [Lachnospiraceae bacterium]
MRVVFMGTPDFAVGTLEAVCDAGYEVVGVVTQPDKAKGRSKEPVPTPVKAAALARGLTVFQPERIRNEQAVETVRQMKPDVIVVVAFGQIIPKEILELAPYGCLNVHASLLPAYRGAAPIQWAVLNGEEESGVTIMRMDEGLDTGDMITKKVVKLAEDETSGSLFERLSEEGAQLLVKTLSSVFDGTAVYEKQPEQSPTPYAGMIRKSMGQIDWNQSAVEIERLVRGMNPWPSAYTKLDGRTLKIWKAHVEKPEMTGDAGKIVRMDNKGLYVQTGLGILCVDELQLEGKKRMKTGDFLRGYVIRNNQL